MKSAISLNGQWQLIGTDSADPDWWSDGTAPSEGTVRAAAVVPGEVHVDLLRAGIIEDPYYGANADSVQWIESKHWWYRRSFEAPESVIGSRTYLEFDGLDTFAHVYLNGEHVGSTNNMFVAHRLDVTGRVNPGENEVMVHFEPAAAVLAEMDCADLFGCFDTHRVNARKMQCAFGWDWAHRFVGAGIWRDARLVICDCVGIADVRVDIEMEGAAANAWVTIEVENSTPLEQPVTATVVAAIGDSRETLEVDESIPPSGGAIEAVVRIEEPQLWWPNGMGEQPLYRLMVGLQTEGEVQDVAEKRFGIRTVRLAERDEFGQPAFTFIINGERVFCKGGNWVPADSFVSNVTPERYRELISLARDANLNMLRVWGGGIYEGDAFYDACDEMGILVWQDFMFSCGSYPDSDEFAQQVAREAEAVVRRLRHHPSIVLWCGNNECDMNLSPDASWHGKRLFTETLPTTLQRLDRTRPYRQSSPYGGRTGNDPAEGDIHRSSWFRAFLEETGEWRRMIEEENGKFVSEFVTQGPPEIESLRQFIPPDKLFPPTNEVWEFHNKDNPHSSRRDGHTHQQILVELTQRLMGDFTTAEEFAAAAGVLQGEFIKAEMEHYRREKWAISGGLMWMFNSCWPSVDWSIVDYFLRPKAAYYFTKRACAPVAVSFKPADDAVQLYVTTDERVRPLRAEMQVGIYTFGACDFSVQSIPVEMQPNASQAFWESMPLGELFDEPARQCLVVFLTSGDRTLARNAFFPLTFGEMQFPQPKLLVSRDQIDETRHRLVVSSDDYARCVGIANIPAAARPSDNYFDLIPGEAYEVTIEAISEEEAKKTTLNVWRR